MDKGREVSGRGWRWGTWRAALQSQMWGSRRCLGPIQLEAQQHFANSGAWELLCRCFREACWPKGPSCCLCS